MPEKRTFLTVEMPDEEKKAAIAKAKADGTTVSKKVRAYLRRYTKTRKANETP